MPARLDYLLSMAEKVAMRKREQTEVTMMEPLKIMRQPYNNAAVSLAELSRCLTTCAAD